MQNYFQLDEPKKWRCCIASEIDNHRPLVLELTRMEPEDHCWLIFPRLFYCETAGCDCWESADFSVAHPEDRLRYLRKFDTLEDVNDNILLSDYYLYYVNSAQGPVRIVSIGRGEIKNRLH